MTNWYQFFHDRVFGPVYPGPIPEPPPLPKYEPGSEPTYWDWKRLVHNGLTADEQAKTLPKIGDIPEDPSKPDWRGVVRNNVVELPMPERVSYGQPIDPNYFFFDTPDWADPFKKLWFSTKFFVKSGVAISCIFGILEHKKFNWENNMYLLGRYFRPWFLGGMITSFSVITIANLRDKKDDYYNYGIAGFVAACYLGKNNHLRFFRNVIIWPTLACATKYNAETNGIMFPVTNPRANSYSVTGMSTENGWRTGDLRFGITGLPEGVGKGRDTRDISKY